MQQLGDKITEVNKSIALGIHGAVMDLHGLCEPVFIDDEKTHVEAGTEIQVSLNSDSDLSAYHIQDGDVDFSKFQNRGKGKLYFPIAPMAIICMSKDRSMEEKLFNIIKSSPNITIKSSSNDKFSIWRDESLGRSTGYGTESKGSKAVNFDYHVFKISYAYNFKTTYCKPFCQ